VVTWTTNDKFARTFMNTTVRQLAESLLVYRDMVRDLVATHGESALQDGVMPRRLASSYTSSSRRLTLHFGKRSERVLWATSRLSPMRLRGSKWAMKGRSEPADQVGRGRILAFRP